MHEGRIVKALSGFYYVMTERKKIYQCKGRGVFRKHKLTPLVGDYVVFQKVNEREGYILKVMGRKNMLVRLPSAMWIRPFSSFPPWNPISARRSLIVF